ncbi:hypothetical protein CDAR_118751 [Caerostris darwini]|uniref:Uncharacterized protein n=1 Tax=Caerostris darwini TaxID=1538125 RepID=A0AAV4TU78_9ARAC|nr:hypothetical protein CDAR_118751 [Caerostris darwini]
MVPQVITLPKVLVPLVLMLPKVLVPQVLTLPKVMVPLAIMLPKVMVPSVFTLLHALTLPQVMLQTPMLPQAMLSEVLALLQGHLSELPLTVNSAKSHLNWKIEVLEVNKDSLNFKVGSSQSVFIPVSRSPNRTHMLIIRNLDFLQQHSCRILGHSFPRKPEDSSFPRGFSSEQILSYLLRSRFKNIQLVSPIGVQSTSYRLLCQTNHADRLKRINRTAFHPPPHHPSIRIKGLDMWVLRFRT